MPPRSDGQLQGVSFCTRHNAGSPRCQGRGPFPLCVLSFDDFVTVRLSLKFLASRAGHWKLHEFVGMDLNGHMNEDFTYLQNIPIEH